MKKISCLFIGILLFAGSFLYAQPTITMVEVDSISANKARFRGNLSDEGTWDNKQIKKVGFILAPVSGYKPGDTLNYGTTYKKVGGYDYYTNKIAYYMKPNTQYWIKAWASNKTSDTVFSSEIYFTTLPGQGTYMTATEATDIGLTKATINGSLDSMGIDEGIMGCGFVFSTSPNPTFGTVGGDTIKSFATVAKNAIPKELTADLEDLISGATYYYRVWVANKYTNTFIDTTYSTQSVFTTHHACGSVPAQYTVDSVDIYTVDLSWEAQEGQSKFEVEYGFAGHVLGEGDTVIVEEPFVRLENLVSNRSYTTYVRAVCSDKYSDWSDLRSFHTLEAPCENIMSLHVEELSYLSAKIAWTPGTASQKKWEVALATSNGTYSNETFLVNENPVYFPIGLKANTEYKVRVRAICPVSHDTVIIDEDGNLSTQTIYDTIYSDWSDDIVFKTWSSSLDEQEYKLYHVDIYPNPSDNVIYFKGNDGHNVIKVEIYSASGTLVYTSAALPAHLNMSEYGKGAFTVHITTANGVQTEKIIIK